MIIKLDLEKAYDRLEWEFVKKTMIDANLPSKLINTIMNCINCGSCMMLWNNEVTDLIQPSHGLR